MIALGVALGGLSTLIGLAVALLGGAVGAATYLKPTPPPVPASVATEQR